jgi:hypothetical protein
VDQERCQLHVCTIHASEIKWWQRYPFYTIQCEPGRGVELYTSGKLCIYKTSMAIPSIQYSAKIVVGIELTIWTTDQSDKNQAAELFLKNPLLALNDLLGNHVNDMMQSGCQLDAMMLLTDDRELLRLGGFHATYTTKLYPRHMVGFRGNGYVDTKQPPFNLSGHDIQAMK